MAVLPHTRKVMVNKRLTIIVYLLFSLAAAGLFSSCGTTSSSSYRHQARQNLYDQYMAMPGQEAAAFASPVVFIPGDASDF